MQRDDDEVVTRTLWEFLDKWLQRLASGDGGSRSIVKVAFVIGVCCYAGLIAWRVWLVSHALTTFGVDIASVLPIAPSTAALIQKGVTVLLLFSPDALFAYLFFNRDVRYWRTVTAIALVGAVGASWWATHDPALGTHCYVITPDRGVILGYADEKKQCRMDRTSGLQMSAVTPPILMCIRAMQRGISPARLAVSAVNTDAMFAADNARSLYWFHRTDAINLEFYDGPGFDQATSTPLEPVTLQNMVPITAYIKGRQAAERAERERTAVAERTAAKRAQMRAAKARASREREAHAEKVRAAQAELREQAERVRAEQEAQARAAQEREDAAAQRRAVQAQAEEERLARLKQAQEEAELRRRAERARAAELYQTRLDAARQRAAEQRGARVQRQVQIGRRRSNGSSGSRPSGSRSSGCGEGGCNSTYGSKKPPLLQ
jgi:hypothetical protein